MPIIVVSYRMQTSMIIIGLFFFICSFVFYVFVYASTMRCCVSGLGHYGVMPSVAPIIILVTPIDMTIVLQLVFIDIDYGLGLCCFCLLFSKKKGLFVFDFLLFLCVVC